MAAPTYGDTFTILLYSLSIKVRKEMASLAENGQK
jgi:hypothetical protein